MKIPRALIVIGFLVTLCPGLASAQVVVPPKAKPTPSKSETLARAGWEAIEAGHAQTAVESFQEAIALDPKNGSLSYGLGLALYHLGREIDSRGALQQALELNPKLLSASQLLGESFFRSGDLEAAIKVLQDALVFAPQSEALQTRLEQLQKEAALESGFRQTTGEGFRIFYDGPAEELADRALAILTSAYWRITTTLGGRPQSLIPVVLYSGEQFRDMTRAPKWSVGTYDGKIRILLRRALQNPIELERTLRHELTHAVVKSMVPRAIPTWLNEGLPGFFEYDDLSRAEETVKRAKSLIPLAQLHGSFRRLPANRVELAYAESALAAKALLDRAGPSSLNLLLTDLADGRPFAEAFERAVGSPYTEFQIEWETSLRPPSQPADAMAPARPATPPQ